MDSGYELKTEIKRCCICKTWIEKTNQLTIVNHNHYHVNCLDTLWFKINKLNRHKIVDKMLHNDGKTPILKELIDEC